MPSVLLVFPYMRQAEKPGPFPRPDPVGWLTVAPDTEFIFRRATRFFLYISGAAFFLRLQSIPASVADISDEMIPAGGRGTATGIYTFFGFIGSSLGGMLGGWFHSHRSLFA